MKAYTRGFIILIFILGFLIFSIIVLALSIVYFLLTKNDPETESKMSVFQISHFDPTTEAKCGIAKISKVLSSNEYLSYSNPGNGVTTIISNFFDGEYECSGYCYCEEENSRRNSATVFNRGFYLLLSAISVTMAVNIAKETFQNKCESSLEGSCAKMNIKSDVDLCVESVKEEEETEDFEYDDIDIKEGEEDDDIQRRVYDCHGFCVSNQYSLYHDTKDIDKIRKGNNLKEARASFGDCSKLEMTGEIIMIIPVNKKRLQALTNNVRSAFRKKYLSKFCRSQSMVEVNIVTQNKKSGSDEYRNDNISPRYFKDVETPACVASNHGDGMKNIRCRLIRKEEIEGVVIFQDIEDL